MKSILSLIVLVFSFTSAAGYVAESKINQCDRRDFAVMSECLSAEGEACYHIPESLGQCGIFKFRNTHAGPKTDVEACAGESECQQQLSSKNCLDGHDAFINEDFTETYCIAINGKEVVIDADLKATKDAEAAQEATKEAAIAQALKAIDHGRRVIALMAVRNVPKNLTTAQIAQMNTIYAEVKGLLETGSLVTAREKINEMTPDETLVTQADKDAIIAEIDSFLAAQ